MSGRYYIGAFTQSSQASGALLPTKQSKARTMSALVPSTSMVDKFVLEFRSAAELGAHNITECLVPETASPPRCGSVVRSGDDVETAVDSGSRCARCNQRWSQLEVGPRYSQSSGRVLVLCGRCSS